MPRLSRNQREQAIGRLGAEQSTQIVGNTYNVNVRTIYRFRNRYNTVPDEFRDSGDAGKCAEFTSLYRIVRPRKHVQNTYF